MRFLWWLGYAGVLAFVVLVVARVTEYVIDAYGGQVAFNLYVWLCIVWLLIRVERVRV